MRCNKCHLHQCSMSQVMPKGSLTPDIYFIIDCPEEEDLRFGQILTGARGRYLESFLTSLNISNYRMWSLVRCTPYATAYTQEALGDTYHVPQTSTIRQPDDMEILACEDYIKMDIQKTQPKLIVPLGGVPLKWLMGDEYNKITKHRGKLYDATINGVTYKVLPTYSPSYVIHNRDNIDITKEFFEDLRKAGQVADGTWVDVMTENKMTFALTYNDFKSYYVSQLMSEPELAYDIETNAELVYHKDFDIIGWSLAKKRNGIYVCCKSLDYEMSDSEAELCKQLLVAILKNTPKITVHNSLYERPATLYNLGYDMPFDKVDDTLVMAKLMLGGKTGAGLKPNAQKIGYPAWDEDLDDYIDLFKTFLARLKLAKFRPVVASMRDGVSLTDIVNQLLQEDTQSQSTTNQEKFAEIIEYVNDLQKLLLKYYEPDEMGHLMDLYTQKVLYGFDNGIPGTIPYNWIPYKMLCKYGATDSLATVDLKDHYIKRFKDESTESVNLAEGYKYALMEHYAGYAMTMAGLAWDDDAAERDFQKFNRICINSLKYILKHPVVEKYVIDHCYDDYVPDVVYDNYNDYFWDAFKRRCICTGQDANGYNTYRLEYEDDNGRVKKKHIKHLMVDIEDKLPPTIKADIESRIAETIRKEIAETDDVDTLKSFFNPASTVPDVFDLASAVLVTPELKFCHFLRLVRDIVHDGEFDINNFTSPDREFLEMFVKYLEIPADKPEDRKQPFMEIEQYVSQVVRFNDDQLKNAYGDSVNLMLEGLDDTSQIMIFDDLCVGPINPDDPTTWTDLFKWLVNLRSYKKSVKIISAYIEGKVGRSSVYVVPHKELSNGDDVVPRLRTYDECEIVNGKAKISADEAFLEQTSFGVGTAETGRWRSAYHVIPTGSSVKKLYTSRFKGGTILQPDFSANELRCVASAAQEENMLQAFREGKDIHRANAAKIYNVPEDQVTTFQRRFAKTLCIHGDTKIRLLSGKIKSVSELYDEFIKGTLDEWVYSYCEDNGKFIPCRINGVSQTRSDTTYAEVTLDNGSKVLTTIDHEFMLKDGSKKQAQDLTVNDSLMAMYFEYTDKNHQDDEGHLGDGYEFFYDPDGHAIATHRRVAETVELGEMGTKSPKTVIHHRDWTKTNNSPDNLKYVNYAEHLSIHQNSEKNLAMDCIDEYIVNHTGLSKLIQRYNTDHHTTLQEYIAEIVVAWYRDKSINKYLTDKDKEMLDIISMFMNDELFLNTVEESLTRSYQSYLERTGYYAGNAEQLKNWDDSRRESQVERMKGVYKYGNRALIIRYMKSLMDNGYEVNEENYNKYRPRANFCKFENLSKYWGDPTQLISEASALPYIGGEIKETDTSNESLQGTLQMDWLWNSDDPEAVNFRKHHSEVHFDMMTSMNNDEEIKKIQLQGKVLRVLNLVGQYLSDEEILNLGYRESVMKYIELTKDKLIGYPTKDEVVIKLFSSLDEALKKSKTYNHTVKSVRIVHSDEPVLFYDIFVNYCHNFLVDLGDNSGVIVGNSFMTLYGGGAYSMADEYFGGDVQKAQKQLDDFFTAFPGLKSWIDERHKEVMETGKVSVLTQRFLNIDFDHNDKRAVSQAMRAAQNYPIQSASSTMAAVIFSDIIRYMRDNNMKTKPVLFIHDSIESDVYPYELLSIIKYEQVKLAHGAVDYFGIECKADVSMGYSLGHECEMTKLEILDDECTKAYITLEGWQDEIFDTMNNWKLAYHKVETVEEEWKEVYTPMAQMFIPRKAYDPSVLSTRKKGSIKIYIQYYNDAGEIEPIATDKSTVGINSIWDNSPLVDLLGK